MIELRIDEILTSQGKNMKWLSDKSSISYTYLTEIVKGKKFPRADNLYAIATALDVDIREIFKPTKEPTEQDMLRYIKEYAEKLEDKL